MHFIKRSRIDAIENPGVSVRWECLDKKQCRRGKERVPKLSIMNESRTREVATGGVTWVLAAFSIPFLVLL